MTTPTQPEWASILGCSNVQTTLIEFIQDKLERKLCPLHNEPLNLYKTFNGGADYVRHQYRCSHQFCICRADFVGNELKSDRLLDTIEYVTRIIDDTLKTKAGNMS